MKKIEIETWKRKELFYNFLNFDDPFFNICAEVNVKQLRLYTQREQESFFLTSYYLVLQVVNSIEAFKLRIRNNEVILHEKVRGSCPILRDDETFGYGYFDYVEEFEQFKTEAKTVMQNIKNKEPFDPGFEIDDLVHTSVIPWVSFKGFEHAKRLRKGDSIPKIVMGKTYENGNEIRMPVSVSGHHSLMDGIHVGKFFQKFQEVLDHPGKQFS